MQRLGCSRATRAVLLSARLTSSRRFLSHDCDSRLPLLFAPRLQFTKNVQTQHRLLSSIRNYSLLPANHPVEGGATTAESQSNNTASEEQARPLTDRVDDESTPAERKAQVEAFKQDQPSYQLTFTCAKCLDRSTHRISKQGYHHGTVLVTCPGCKNKHLISDHLRIFSDKDVTLEDIMKEKGELLKKGVLGADGDVEFYAETDSHVVNKTSPGIIRRVKTVQG